MRVRTIIREDGNASLPMPHLMPVHPLRCQDCLALQYLPRESAPHPGLRFTDFRERHTRGLGVIRWDHYQCDHCQSRWVWQSDDLGGYWFDAAAEPF